MAGTTYLITGANRGIGRGMVQQLLLRPNTTVIAGVRRPSDPTSVSLLDLPANNSRLFVKKLVDDADFEGLAAAVRSGDGLVPGNNNTGNEAVSRLDVVVANAGNSDSLDKSLLETTPEDVVRDCAVNAAGALRLFRACWPLMGTSEATAGTAPTDASSSAASLSGPKFILISSTLGSIAILDEEDMPTGIAYGMSKAAANWFAKKLAVQFRSRGLVVGILHPGWVQTNMGQALADAVGFKEPPVTVEDSARGCLEQIDNWTMDKTGQFLTQTGAKMPW